MKLKNFFLMLAVVLAGGMMFTACSDDDDKDDNGGGGDENSKIDKALVGVWASDENPVDEWYNDDDEYAGDEYFYMIYNADGTCAMLNVFFDLDEKYVGSVIERGEWSVKEGKLTETYEGLPTEYDYTVKGNKFTQSFYNEYEEETVTWKYTKATDKDIQKWIDEAEDYVEEGWDDGDDDDGDDDDDDDDGDDDDGDDWVKFRKPLKK